MIRRGQIWWAGLPEPVGSGPGFRRPVLIIQSDVFNSSRIQTVIVAVITSNVNLGRAPGNVILRAGFSDLKVDSVVNVSQLITIDQSLLTEYAGTVAPRTMSQVDRGLRLVLAL